jgi:hypothetical protein
MTRAYYNEFDPYAAQWLRNLIDAGLIAPGDVDTRSITDVRPADLAGYTQAHFFAGIGGWSLAARLAGWPDDRPLWTGSAPCQPFSVAGAQKGQSDERHLWPVFAELIRTVRPPVDAVDRAKGKLNSRGEPKLSGQVVAMWPTPTSRDWKDGGPQPNVEINGLLGRMVWPGSGEPTEKPGALNPAFVCWLMGFKPEWDACAPTAMPSSRKSRPKSSAPISTPKEPGLFD